jgi:hypothetical protein
VPRGRLVGVGVGVGVGAAPPGLPHFPDQMRSFSFLAPRPASEGCPAGNFCLYTGPEWSGRVFRLFHCQEYALSRWNGYGSWYNNDTGGGTGDRVEGVNRRVAVHPNADMECSRS